MYEYDRPDPTGHRGQSLHAQDRVLPPDAADEIARLSDALLDAAERAEREEAAKRDWVKRAQRLANENTTLRTLVRDIESAIENTLD